MSNLLGHSRKFWRDRNYYVEKTENVHRRGKQVWRTDLHGFGDLVAMKGPEYILLQVTSWAEVPRRVRKIVDGEATIGKGQWEVNLRVVARYFLTVPGHRVIVEGWRKRNGRWERRKHEITKEEVS